MIIVSCALCNARCYDDDVEMMMEMKMIKMLSV